MSLAGVWWEVWWSRAEQCSGGWACYPGVKQRAKGVGAVKNSGGSIRRVLAGEPNIRLNARGG